MAKTFSLIRKIHLYAAFAIAAFLLMYFVTGAVLIMEKTFARKNIEEKSQKLFTNHEAESAVVAKLRNQYQIVGEERKNVKSTETVYTYYRPGYRAEIKFVANEDSVTLNLSKGNYALLMIDFHRLVGFDSITHIIWGVLYDLSCIALFIFGLSGLYLWWKTEKNKLVGGIFFLSSTAITVFTIWYLLAIC